MWSQEIRQYRAEVCEAGRVWAEVKKLYPRQLRGQEIQRSALCLWPHNRLHGVHFRHDWGDFALKCGPCTGWARTKPWKLRHTPTNTPEMGVQPADAPPWKGWCVWKKRNRRSRIHVWRKQGYHAVPGQNLAIVWPRAVRSCCRGRFCRKMPATQSDGDRKSSWSRKPP